LGGKDTSESDSKVLTNNLVHLDLSFFELGISESNAKSLVTLLTLEQDRVTLVNFEFSELGGIQSDGRIIVVSGFINLKSLSGHLLIIQTNGWEPSSFPRWQ
jgi:hypothetical protein